MPGIGVYCNHEKLNLAVTKTLKEEPLTNAHAELTAVSLSLELITKQKLRNEQIIINSDA